MRVRTHPGEVLREEFMKPLGLSANSLALALRVPVTRMNDIVRERRSVTRMNDIVRERRSVTADTALRLARYFGTTPEFWLNLQQAHDLSKVEVEQGPEIEKFVAPREEARAGG